MRARFHFLINDQLAPLLGDRMSPSGFITINTSKMTKQGDRCQERQNCPPPSSHIPDSLSCQLQHFCS